jgi:hypothetical protein
MQHEPLLPRLQLLDAVIESFSIPGFDVLQYVIKQLSDSPRRGRAPIQKRLRSPAILRWPGPLTSHAHRIGPAGLYFQPSFDPHLVLP